MISLFTFLFIWLSLFRISRSYEDWLNVPYCDAVIIRGQAFAFRFLNHPVTGPHLLTLVSEGKGSPFYSVALQTGYNLTLHFTFGSFTLMPSSGGLFPISLKIFRQFRRNTATLFILSPPIRTRGFTSTRCAIFSHVLKIIENGGLGHSSRLRLQQDPLGA